MVQRRMPTFASFSALMCCCALIILPGTAAAQTPVPGTTDAAAPVQAAAADETIEVDAPRLFTPGTQRTNGNLQKASLEGHVNYADLDLRKDDGVAELRSRIAQKAADICAQLSQLYPVYAASGTSCVKDAIQDGTVRANRVIAQARQPSY